MDVFEALQQTRSVMKYSDQPVEWEKIAKIMHAGHLAQSAGNIQDWRFIAIIDRDNRADLAEACLKQWWMQTAPVHIIVCGDPGKHEAYFGDAGKTYCIQGCAAAVENMVLQATAERLGSSIVYSFDEYKVKQLFDIPDNVLVVAIVTLGYYHEEVPEPMRFALDNVVYLEKWKNKDKYKDIALGNYNKIVEKAKKQGARVVQEKKEKIKPKVDRLKEKIKSSLRRKTKA